MAGLDIEHFLEVENNHLLLGVEGSKQSTAKGGWCSNVRDKLPKTITLATQREGRLEWEKEKWILEQNIWSGISIFVSPLS